MSATQTEFSPLLPFRFYYPEAVDTNGVQTIGFSREETRSWVDLVNCHHTVGNWSHIAQCDDLQDLQIDSPVSNDLLIKRVSDDGTEVTIAPTNPSGTLREYAIDWSAATCPEEYYLEIAGGTVGSAQIITGDDSTFDASTGSATGPQTEAHETVTPIRTGAGSLKVTLDTNDVEGVSLKSSVTFTAGQNYVISIYTWIESAQAAFVVGDIGFSLATNPTKRQIISETRIDTSDTKDAWVELRLEFIALEDHVDDVKILASTGWDYLNTPVMWLDDFTITESDKVELIRSECINVKASFSCDEVITYSNDEITGVLDFDTPIILKTRLPMLVKDYIPNVQNTVLVKSTGSRIKIRSEQTASETFYFDQMPAVMVEKLTAITNCDNVTVNGTGYVQDASPKVDYIARYSLARMEIDMVRTTGILVNTNC